VLGAGVSIVLEDGKEHIYELKGVNNVPISYLDAKGSAAASYHDTLQGYLATITSAVENAFLTSKLIDNTWIGASDAASEGTWIWDCGPEKGDPFWNGLAANASPPGSSVPGMYSNWYSGEPNNAGDEDYAHFWGTGTQKGFWNDYSNTNTVYYYLVEYGGFDHSPVSLGSSDYATVNVITNQPPVANNDFYYIYENTTRTIPDRGVLINDTDPDLTNTLYVNPNTGIVVSHGTLSVNLNGGFSYTPTLNSTTDASFSYRCWDGTVGVYANCYLYVRTPQYLNSGNFDEDDKWNGGYVPPNIDTDMDIIVSGTMTTTTNLNVFSLTVTGTMTANHTVNLQSLAVSGTLNVNNNIVVDNLTIHTNATLNFSNGATITVNNSISNQTRTGMQISAPVILHSGVKIH